MGNIISIKKLNFKYKDCLIIDNLDFDIESGSIMTLVGNTGGGKTTLVKLITGLLTGDGSIRMFNFLVTDIPHYIKKDMGIVLGNPYNNFIANTVYDDLIFPLENLGMKPEEIKKYVADIIKQFKLEELLDLNPRKLSCEDASIVALASALVTKPKILILDDAFAKIGDFHKEKIFKILKQMNKKYKLTILNVTHDINEIMYGTDAAILYNGKIVLNDKVENYIKYEKKLRRYKYELPFIMDFNNKLKYYNVIDQTMFDMNRMVNVIWK